MSHDVQLRIIKELGEVDEQGLTPVGFRTINLGAYQTLQLLVDLEEKGLVHALYTNHNHGVFKLSPVGWAVYTALQADLRANHPSAQRPPSAIVSSFMDEERRNRAATIARLPNDTDTYGR